MLRIRTSGSKKETVEIQRMFSHTLGIIMIIFKFNIEFREDGSSHRLNLQYKSRIIMCIRDIPTYYDFTCVSDCGQNTGMYTVVLTDRHPSRQILLYLSHPYQTTCIAGL